MVDDRPTLIVPVEDQVRELDAKILMACAAAERGLQVVLGSWQYVNFILPRLERGIYIAKGMRPRNALVLNILRRLGHTVVGWDEESLVRFSSPEFYPWRFSEKAFACLSHLFAWGQDDADLFNAYPGNCGVPIHVTGNPRIDLLRPELRGYFEADAARLRERFGDFILVNTNFASVNAFVPDFNAPARLEPGAEPTAVSRAAKGLSPSFAAGRAEHQRAIFEGFRELLPKLSEWFPEHRIIVRPHPTEDHAAWRSHVAGLDNIQVLHEGNVVPWLLACRVLLHNGCTTAIEATVLGKPVVSYQPVTAESYDYHLPNSLSHIATTPEAVARFLDDILRGRLGQIEETQRRRILDRHLASLTGRLAVDRVIDVLEEAGYLDNRPVRPDAIRYAAAWVVANGRTLIKQIHLRRNGHWNSAAYHAHRFPEIGVEEIESRVRRLQAELDRFTGIRVQRTGRYIFHISSDTVVRNGPSNLPDEIVRGSPVATCDYGARTDRAADMKGG